MAVTLQQLKLATQDKIAQGLISELQASSLLLDRLTFADCVSAAGGSNLTYGYNRVKTPSKAAFRNLNAEYTPSEAEFEPVTVELGILGGSYEIDRVVAQATSGAPVDEVIVQLSEKRKATVRAFNNAVVNGTKATGRFDGLAAGLAGTATEATSIVDISTFDAMKDNAIAFMYDFKQWLKKLSRKPDLLLVGSTMATKLETIASILGQYQVKTTEAGLDYGMFAGIPFEDLGPANETGTDVIATEDVYGVCLGLDEFHGVTLTGGNALSVYTPDFDAPGAVKKGEVEFVCATALKATKAAGVYHPKPGTEG